jgi:hypothetical protein
MAVPSENPIVAANLPLVLSKPRGFDSPTEALRAAVLGIAAIHQSCLLARGGAAPEGADEMMQIAHQYRMNSKLHLAKACSTVEGTRSDASLAAALAIMLTDVSLVESVYLRDLTCFLVFRFSRVVKTGRRIWTQPKTWCAFAVVPRFCSPVVHLQNQGLLRVSPETGCF